MNINITDDEFIKIVNESNSMAEAASKLGIHFNTFKRHTSRLGIYKPNQGGKRGKKRGTIKIPTNEILNGEHPHFQTFKLKNRLLREGIIENKCEICGISDWNDKQLNCELDHKDGDRTNHKLENLRILCPNCHSQTDTYRSKNRS